MLRRFPRSRKVKVDAKARGSLGLDEQGQGSDKYNLSRLINEMRGHIETIAQASQSQRLGRDADDATSPAALAGSSILRPAPLLLPGGSSGDGDLARRGRPEPQAVCPYASIINKTPLTRFIDDGGMEIDSNTVERSVRPMALNRKNALFAGSDAGAEHWATIASLIETAKLNVEPMAYLIDVIIKIVNGHPNSQIDDLLPWAYAEKPNAKAVA